MDTQSVTTRRLLTVAQFCEAHPWAHPGGVRAWLFNRRTNGFDSCIRRIGRKILLDETAVFAWVDAQSGVHQ